jgi:predicted Mrr-cat superfamily restriction endonuclease
LLDVFSPSPTPPPHSITTNHWQISLGGDAKKWDEWRKKKIIAIGFKEVFQSAGEKILGKSEEEIKKMYEDTYPENPNLDEETNSIINFLHKMQEGHYVLIEQGGSELGWGIIKSGPLA